jgi:hypothetical protein
MPAVSEQQRKWAFAVKGEKWARAHHYDNKGKLPKHAKKRKPGSQEEMVRRFMNRRKRGRT